MSTDDSVINQLSAHRVYKFPLVVDAFRVNIGHTAYQGEVTLFKQIKPI